MYSNSKYSPIKTHASVMNMAKEKWRSSLNLSGKNPAYPNFVPRGVNSTEMKRRHSRPSDLTAYENMNHMRRPSENSLVCEN